MRERTLRWLDLDMHSPWIPPGVPHRLIDGLPAVEFDTNWLQAEPNLRGQARSGWWAGMAEYPALYGPALAATTARMHASWHVMDDGWR